MEPFHERLLSERAALAEKLDGLRAFLNRPDASDVVGKSQRVLMLRQFDFMVGYLDVLDRRLALLGGS